MGLDKEFNVVYRGPYRKPYYDGVQWAPLQVRSVHHTGTDFINKVLKDAGWNETRSCHWDADRRSEGLMISPIRNPSDSYITWESRGRTEDFFLLWKIFNKAFLKNKDLFIVPVDTSDRQDWLDKLSSRLKCKLKTDWKPVNSQPRKEVEKIDLSEIYKLPVVEKFYEAF